MSDRTVRFDLTGANDRELPLILGLMPVLAKHATNADTFEDTTFEPIIGSGPYTIGTVDPGRSILFKRNPNYWGRDLPINRGLLHFDEVRFDYLSRLQLALRGFSARASTMFASEARSPPLGNRLPTSPPCVAAASSRTAFTRRAALTILPALSSTPAAPSSPIFASARRSACCSISSGSITISSMIATSAPRAISRTPLSARGRSRLRSASAQLLKPFPDVGPRSDFMEGTWQPAATDGSGRDRHHAAARARCCCKTAGYALDGTVLRSIPSFTIRSAFEIFVNTSEEQRRLALAYARDLERAAVARPRVGRRRAVRSAPTRLRLRHDRIPLGSVAVARQRAEASTGFRARPAPTAPAITWACKAPPSAVP